MKLTIKEIAALSGVGKSTVSRVLNGDPNVKPTTRAKVQKVIDEVKFSPNRAARAMRGSREKVVGVIVTRLNSPSESQTLSAILQALRQHNITPWVAESQFDLAQLKQEMDLFKNRKLDGLILFGFSGLTANAFQHWTAPLVTMVRAYPHHSAVYYDDEKAIRYLADLLYQQGHRRIGYLGVADSDDTTGKQRTQAYFDFCKQYQLSPRWALADLSLESGYEKMPELWATDFSALICATSTLAAGAVKYLQKIQQKRPLVCVGRTPLLHALVPELTSLDFGYEQAGRLAVQLLLAQLQGDRRVIQQQIPFNIENEM